MLIDDGNPDAKLIRLLCLAGALGASLFYFAWNSLKADDDNNCRKRKKPSVSAQRADVSTPLSPHISVASGRNISVDDAEFWLLPPHSNCNILERNSQIYSESISDYTIPIQFRTGIRVEFPQNDDLFETYYMNDPNQIFETFTDQSLMQSTFISERPAITEIVSPLPGKLSSTRNDVGEKIKSRTSSDLLASSTLKSLSGEDKSDMELKQHKQDETSTIDVTKFDDIEIEEPMEKTHVKDIQQTGSNILLKKQSKTVIQKKSKQNKILEKLSSIEKTLSELTDSVTSIPTIEAKSHVISDDYKIDRSKTPETTTDDMIELSQEIIPSISEEEKISQKIKEKARRQSRQLSQEIILSISEEEKIYLKTKEVKIESSPKTSSDISEEEDELKRQKETIKLKITPASKSNLLKKSENIKLKESKGQSEKITPKILQEQILASSKKKLSDDISEKNSFTKQLSDLLSEKNSSTKSDLSETVSVKLLSKQSTASSQIFDKLSEPLLISEKVIRSQSKISRRKGDKETSGDIPKIEKQEEISRFKNKEDFYDFIDSELLKPRTLRLIENLYVIMAEYLDNYLHEPGYLWRYIKVTLIYADMLSGGKCRKLKRDLYYSAKRLALIGLKMHPNDSQLNKWYAIALGILGDNYLPVAQNIKLGWEIKERLNFALRQNSKDGLAHFFVGLWHFKMSLLTFRERLILLTMGIWAPIGHLESAINHFMEAYYLDPSLEIDSAAMLAECFDREGDDISLEKWRRIVENLKTRNSISTILSSSSTGSYLASSSDPTSPS